MPQGRVIDVNVAVHSFGERPAVEPAFRLLASGEAGELLEVAECDRLGHRGGKLGDQAADVIVALAAQKRIVSARCSVLARESRQPLVLLRAPPPEIAHDVPRDSEEPRRERIGRIVAAGAPQAYDRLTVTIRNTSNSVLRTLATYSNLNENSTYVQKSFDVLDFRGETIRVYFRGTEDYTLQTSFVIDDTALNVTQWRKPAGSRPRGRFPRNLKTARTTLPCFCDRLSCGGRGGACRPTPP